MSRDDNHWISRNECRRWIPSTQRAILEILIILALALLYLQLFRGMAKYGTMGTSPVTVLLFCLFSTFQLASRFSMPNDLQELHCIQSGYVRGWQAAAVCISQILVLAQWACAMLSLYFFTRYRSSTIPNPETMPLRASSNNAGLTHKSPAAMPGLELPSDLLLLIVSVHVFVVLVPGIALTLTLMPLTRASVRRSWAMNALHILTLYLFQWYCMLLSILAVAIICVSMVFDTFSFSDQTMADHTHFHLWSLALRAMAFFFLGVSQFLRPVYREGWQWENKFVEWYWIQGKVSINYFIVAGGYFVALAVGVYHNRFLGKV